MNERIKQITDKIWEEKYWTNPNTDKLLPAQLNKFAELIVRECIGIVDSHRAKMDSGPMYIIHDFKKHFGVEE